jgi:aminoglycoside/choline kinase family phosphotransferase
MNSSVEQALEQLFYSWAGEKVEQLTPLVPAASRRLYFRLEGPTRTAVGTWNPNQQENAAFLHFAHQFRKNGIHVPEIYAESPDAQAYLQQDLGDLSLYQLLPEPGTPFSDDLIEKYKHVLSKLAYLQGPGSKGVDYQYAYPTPVFDHQSMLWDLNYYKYYFLKYLDIPFDEIALEKEFQQLCSWLSQADAEYFMYRDFQSRNIMYHQNEPWFIDFQGGRKGPVFYDVVSLLWQAKANLPHELRTQLLDHYLEQFRNYATVNLASAHDYFYGFSLLRTLQVLAVYGLRGLIERKQHFLDSIPFALKNATWLFEQIDFPYDFPEIKKGIQSAQENPILQSFDLSAGKSSPLVVTINSFSFKRGVPPDPSGHGGGFIFDCRAIHNPGRYPAYKQLTGRDEPVKAFLKQQSRIDDFLNHVYGLVDQSVEQYIQRNFESLTIHFGCTGGQHRSVYSADQLAAHLRRKYGVKVKLTHVEQERKGWVNE